MAREVGGLKGAVRVVDAAISECSAPSTRAVSPVETARAFEIPRRTVGTASPESAVGVGVATSPKLARGITQPFAPVRDPLDGFQANPRAAALARPAAHRIQKSQRLRRAAFASHMMRERQPSRNHLELLDDSIPWKGATVLKRRRHALLAPALASRRRSNARVPIYRNCVRSRRGGNAAFGGWSPLPNRIAAKKHVKAPLLRDRIKSLQRAFILRSDGGRSSLARWMLAGEFGRSRPPAIAAPGNPAQSR